MVLSVAACQAPAPKETYPYGMNEKEWNELSIRDKTLIRRDYHFYEKGQLNFVNPDIQIEGRKEQPNAFKAQPKAPATPAAPKAEANE